MIESKSPRFSIIINVFNGEKHLPDAIRSIFAQTFSDWELIIWDDRSTDNTAAICKKLTDERVSYYLAPKHTSVGPARDSAVRLAKGEWLAFLDHDDVWAPNKLAEQSRLIDQDTSKKLGIVYGWTVQFYDSGKTEAFDRWHSRDELPEGDIFQELIAKPSFIAFSSGVLLRSAVLEVGGIPPSVNITSDYFLFLLVARDYLAARVTETVCWYRKHESSITFSGRSKILIHYEVLFILDICSSAIDASILRYRKRVHMTHIGLWEILTGEAIFQGFARIISQGSLCYLLSRPFAISWRYFSKLLAAR